jgi:ABC-type nickel/cobalt efflux system permease component RcnA
MDGLWAAYATAFALGAVHALEVDHLVAVSVFVGRRPRVATAAAFGARWGLGHAFIVFVVGGLLAWSGVKVPAAATGWTELAVGAMLVGLGLWALRIARRLHIHEPHQHGGHAHLHAHPPETHPHDHRRVDPAARHRHLPTLVGAVHGLAGSVPLVALIPVSLLTDLGSALLYLFAFGVGSVLAMALYAALAATAADMAARSESAARLVARLTALASGAVGIWWILRAGADLAR